jgi:PAS domain-containing protein
MLCCDCETDPWGITEQSIKQQLATAGQAGLLALLEDGIDMMELGVALFDADLRLLECNPLFRKIRGYPIALCQTGTPLLNLLEHDHACGLLRDGRGSDESPVGAWLESAQKRRRHSSEDELEDGRIIATALTPISQQGVIVTVSDISRRRTMEASIRSRDELLELVTEASSEGIYDWNVSSGELKVSFRLTAMLGLTPGHLSAAISAAKTGWITRL